MSNNNYELYRKNKVDIFNMIYDTWERSPMPPTLYPEWATKEENVDRLIAYLKEICQ